MGAAPGSQPSGDAGAPSGPAPIALFVYARPDHTRRTLAALEANPLAGESDLYIFADGPRPNDARGVEAVRELISEPWNFRSVTIVPREGNLGLADNIVAGIGSILERHDAVIVIEDDIVTDRNFLTFMNACLGTFRDEKRVWHINGWTYPVEHDTGGSIYFTPLMECWGWATWRDRWSSYRRDPAALVQSWRADQIRGFNAGGYYDYWFDVKRNAWGVVRTWAVFWYATIFAQKGLCVSPPVSMTENIGIDGSGENSGPRDIYRTDVRREADMPSLSFDRIETDRDSFAKDVGYLRETRPPLWLKAARYAKWKSKHLKLMLSRPAPGAGDR